MNPSAIAHLVVAMLLPELVAGGANVQWRQVESKFDVTLQKLIPLHWVEGPLQKAGDLVLEAAAVVWAHPAQVQDLLGTLNSGDLVGAEVKTKSLLVAVEPQLAPLLGG